MKATLMIKAAVLMFVSVVLASCEAFTAAPDPVTGIRMDAPPEWKGTPDPRDTPETYVKRPESMGRFGPHSEFYP